MRGCQPGLKLQDKIVHLLRYGKQFMLIGYWRGVWMIDRDKTLI
jgi:hypothetical protein